LGLVALGLGIPREKNFSNDLTELLNEGVQTRDKTVKHERRARDKQLACDREDIPTDQTVRTAVLLAFSPTRIHAPPAQV
jgi:hypothetical protein